jgi:hypothetical protein
MSRKPVKQYGRLSEHTLLDIIYVLDKINRHQGYDGPATNYFLTEYVTSTIANTALQCIILMGEWS